MQYVMQTYTENNFVAVCYRVVSYYLLFVCFFFFSLYTALMGLALIYVIKRYKPFNSKLFFSETFASFTFNC